MIHALAIAASAAFLALGASGAQSPERAAGDGAASHRCETAQSRPLPAGAAYDRLNAVQSDSLWLKKRLLAKYPDRIAGIYHAPVAGDPMRVKMVVRLKGEMPIPAMKLGHRAKDVPVVVEYGAPYSLADVQALRARIDHRLTALLPTLNGTAFDEDKGAMWLDVYAPDDAAKAAALAKCAEIERLYGLPVQMAFSKGRITLHAG